MSELTCCPKCGSTQGLQYKLKETRTCVLGYNGEQSCDVIEINSVPKTGECFDCGHRIKLSRILNN